MSGFKIPLLSAKSAPLPPAGTEVVPPINRVSSNSSEEGHSRNTGASSWAEEFQALPQTSTTNPGSNITVVSQVLVPPQVEPMDATATVVRDLARAIANDPRSKSNGRSRAKDAFVAALVGHRIKSERKACFHKVPPFEKISDEETKIAALIVKLADKQGKTFKLNGAIIKERSGKNPLQWRVQLISGLQNCYDRALADRRFKLPNFLSHVVGNSSESSSPAATNTGYGKRSRQPDQSPSGFTPQAKAVRDRSASTRPNTNPVVHSISSSSSSSDTRRDPRSPPPKSAEKPPPKVARVAKEDDNLVLLAFDAVNEKKPVPELVADVVRKALTFWRRTPEGKVLDLWGCEHRPREGAVGIFLYTKTTAPLLHRWLQACTFQGLKLEIRWKSDFFHILLSIPPCLYKDSITELWEDMVEANDLKGLLRQAPAWVNPSGNYRQMQIFANPEMLRSILVVMDAAVADNISPRHVKNCLFVLCSRSEPSFKRSEAMVFLAKCAQNASLQAEMEAAMSNMALVTIEPVAYSFALGSTKLVQEPILLHGPNYPMVPAVSTVVVPEAMVEGQAGAESLKAIENTNSAPIPSLALALVDHSSVADRNASLYDVANPIPLRKGGRPILPFSPLDPLNLLGGGSEPMDDLPDYEDDAQGDTGKSPNSSNKSQSHFSEPTNDVSSGNIETKTLNQTENITPELAACEKQSPPTQKSLKKPIKKASKKKKSRKP